MSDYGDSDNDEQMLYMEEDYDVGSDEDEEYDDPIADIMRQFQGEVPPYRLASFLQRLEENGFPRDWGALHPMVINSMLITSNGEEEDDEDVIGILNHLVASVQGNSTQAWQEVITFLDELHQTPKAHGLTVQSRQSQLHGLGSPLHFILERDAPVEVVRKLIGIKSDSGYCVGVNMLDEIDYNGQLPIHVAARNLASIAVFEEILQHSTLDQLLFPDEAFMKPIDVICEHPHHLSRAATEFKRIKNQEQPYAEGDLFSIFQRGYKILEYVRRLTFERDDKKESDGITSLYTAIEYEFPAEFIEAIMILYPEQIYYRDANGRNILIQFLYHSNSGYWRGEDGTCPFIHQLLEINPTFTSDPDKSGRVALNYAIDLECDDKITLQILEKTPQQVLLSRDLETRLFPFMQCHNLNLGFLLLRQQPLAAVGLGQDSLRLKLEKK